jgi:hypothetical protein
VVAKLRLLPLPVTIDIIGTKVLMYETAKTTTGT